MKPIKELDFNNDNPIYEDILEEEIDSEEDIDNIIHVSFGNLKNGGHY